MARKLVEMASDSSLSPPPEDVKAPITAADSKAAAKGKKRKADSSAKATGTKRARTKKEENMAPLEQRTVGSQLRVGAHVSTAGGVQNAIHNLVHIGANAFAFFLKNQRTWKTPALDPENATLFIDGCKHHGINLSDSCVPHGSYLVNLAHPDEDRKAQAYSSFRDDLTRCHKLGIRLYNFHPGNSNACTREEGIKLIAEAINKAHKDPETGEVVPLLETMASLGNTIGGTFKDIAEIIALVEDKERIGVCLDTCHVFAAGYDLRTPEAYSETMTEFDNIIGLKYLRALHVNDSKAPLASHRDLHARIGTGYLGLRSFHNIVNDERLHGMPMVLETPTEVKDENGKKVEDKSIWSREIKMLEQLVGMDVDGEQFKRWEKDLFEEGEGERERVGGQVKRKQAKDETPKKKKRGKKVKSEDGEE
ncbi:AP endonuclease [Byssothecium circinans]|uniref:Apurinic-apyrimidinic endonuclease 1 n=1 Tax=Byssothecium circinans TaxID=147558 RepID=A0A6A5UQB1_9PLEO|nr:AP endonuclease [Byssothecium circinans]